MILCVLAGLVIGIIRASLGYRSVENYFGGAFDGFAGGAIVGIIGTLVLSEMMPMHDVVYAPRTLVSMGSSDGISGTFLWGTGSIGNSETYKFLERMEDGSMVPGSVLVDSRVHLFEDSELKNSGSLIITVNEPDKSSLLYRWDLGGGFKTVVRLEFHVPAGTVAYPQFSIK
jgi:hypothetical protein